MSNKSTTKTVLILLIAVVLFNLYISPQLPEEIATHWNANNVPDDYMSKFWGLYLLPLIALGVFLLLRFIPNIDPLKKNIESFKKYYNNFIVAIIAFLLYVHLLVVYWNLGNEFDLFRYMIPAIGVLFFMIGIIMEHTKRNWFIGIRTPWTLSSDTVWDRTHKLGGKLFKFAGVITLIGYALNTHLVWWLITPVIVAAIIPVVYSYFVYRKLK